MRIYTGLSKAFFHFFNKRTQLWCWVKKKICLELLGQLLFVTNAQWLRQTKTSICACIKVWRDHSKGYPIGATFYFWLQSSTKIGYVIPVKQRDRLVSSRWFESTWLHQQGATTFTFLPMIYTFQGPKLFECRTKRMWNK